VTPAVVGAIVGGSLAVVAIALGVLFYLRHRARRRRLGEALATFAADILTDVMIPDGADGGFSVDVLVRCTRGILVLDVRDIRGALFAAEHMDHWTVMDGGRRWTFPNPLESLYDRIAAIRSIVGDDAPVEGAVVLLEPARFATEAPPRVLLLNELKGYAEPAADVGELHAAAWAALAAQAEPTPRSLRRR
jgi:hypothetical protein